MREQQPKHSVRELLGQLAKAWRQLVIETLGSEERQQLLAARLQLGLGPVPPGPS
jgi:hypothetical protein